MSAGEQVPEATCKESLQVRSEASGQWTVPVWHGVSVVKDSLTTELGARTGCVATIKKNLMVAQPLLPEAGAMDGADLRALAELEEQVNLWNNRA